MSDRVEGAMSLMSDGSPSGICNPAPVLCRQSLEQTEGLLTERPAVLFSVVSFEERCLGSAYELARADCRIDTLILYEYDTIAEPLDLDRELRIRHKKEIGAALGRIPVFEAVMNPYATAGLREDLRTRLAALADHVVIFDVSCMTQVHILSVSSVVVEIIRNGAMDSAQFLFCYSAPESYIQLRGGRPGWRDTLMVPIGAYTPFRREGHAHGVILSGHDVERLSVALEELEPGAGCVIFSNTPSRPDFVQRARELNEAVTERLLALRFPRLENGQVYAREGWREITIDIQDFAGLAAAVASEMRRGLEDAGPVVLYPFGPKVLLLASSLQLAWEAGLSAWAMYPVPNRYRVGVTDGIATTSFLAPAGLAR